MAIDARGVYQLTAEAYHGDPCPAPSLSASLAQLMIEECPALVHHEHPRLNDAWEPDSRQDFDIGTAAHLAILQPELYGARVVETDFDSWRGHNAKVRDRAHDEGKVPLLLQNQALIADLKDAIRQHPIASCAFATGEIERSLVWYAKDAGIWCRCRPDCLWMDRDYIVDLKTSVTANPRKLKRIAADQGWHQRAAWYIEGYEAVFGRTPTYYFVVVAKNPPHLISTVDLSDRALAWGALLNEEARRRFAKCLTTGQWPGYRAVETPDKDTTITIPIPAWADRDLEDRRAAGEFEAAMRYQAPLETDYAA